ncbi:hypothetical protein V6N13_030794 [Hibiscus sabdariffa]
MDETFDPGAFSSHNSRKHRRLDDDPPDDGETRPAGTILPPSYKDSLMKDNSTAIHDADDEICPDMIPKSDRVAPDEVQAMMKSSDTSPPASDAPLNCNSDIVDSFGPWMLAERRPRRDARIQKAASASAPIQIQGSRFNPFLASDADTEVAIFVGNKVTPTVSSQQARQPLAPSTLKDSGKKKVVSTGKTPRASPMRKPLQVNLSDFPVLSRFSAKASSSRSKPALNQGTPLDSTRHATSVMKENDEPNIVNMPRGFVDTLERADVPIVGDPPDVVTNMDGQLVDRHLPLQGSGKPGVVPDVNSHSADGYRVMAMLE